MKYRKKPVDVEAIQYFNADDGKITLDECIRFGEGKVTTESEVLSIDSSVEGVYLTIETLEGNMKINNGDWIIKGITGEFYPCKPDIFEKTYDKVEEDRL